MSTSTISPGQTAVDVDIAAVTTADRRVAAALLGLGALLLMVGNGAHPVDAEPSATSRLLIADSASWIPVHLVLAVGFLGVAMGVMALAVTFRQPLARAVGRIASWSALVGGTLLFAVFGGLDGHAMAALTRSGLAPGANGAAEAVNDVPAAVAVDLVDTGLAAMGTFALLGLALVALGAAMVSEGRGSRWWGALAALLGAGGVVAGGALVATGATATTINVLLRPIGLATTVYFLALSVRVWRASTTPAG